MKNMNLVNIAQAVHGSLVCEASQQNIIIEGVTIDSRKVKQGDLFIATVGERADGHDYIGEVYQKGAVCVICNRPPIQEGCPYILVEDSFTALKEMAEFYRMQLDIIVVGITGSVGKTSTKEFIASVLAQEFKVLKTEGNFNNEVGLPLTVLNITAEHQVAVLEMGISDFGEMTRLSKIAKPNICVFTNIGQSHLEKLESRDGILKAKTEMFQYMAADGYVCVNGDDDKLSGISMVKGKTPISFGMVTLNDVYPTEVRHQGLEGSDCIFYIGGKNCNVHIPIPGEHMIYNALAACAVGNLLNLSIQQIVTGIESVQAVGGRSNTIKSGTQVIIDDCYNANPISMKAAIDMLATAPTRKVAILGDMGELGTDKETLHATIGHYAVEKKIPVIICIGILSKYMYEEALLTQQQNETSEQIYYFEEKESFLKEMPNILKEKDTILVKASHSMAFNQIVSALQDPLSLDSQPHSKDSHS